MPPSNLGCQSQGLQKKTSFISGAMYTLVLLLIPNGHCSHPLFVTLNSNRFLPLDVNYVASARQLARISSNPMIWRMPHLQSQTLACMVLIHFMQLLPRGRALF